MGTSTDAYLFFGICWGEEDHVWAWNLDEEGCPKEDADEWVDDDTWMEENLPGLKDEILLLTHCSDRAPMGLAALAPSWKCAHRGHPERIEPSFLQIPEEVMTGWLQMLETFCARAGYDFALLQQEGQVGWFLASDWSG